VDHTPAFTVYGQHMLVKSSMGRTGQTDGSGCAECFEGADGLGDAYGWEGGWVGVGVQMGRAVHARHTHASVPPSCSTWRFLMMHHSMKRTLLLRYWAGPPPLVPSTSTPVPVRPVAVAALLLPPAPPLPP
jgi:hypothetical protein